MIMTKTSAISTPLTDTVIGNLKAGDEVLLSGIVFTARDAAHKRLVELIDKGKELPIDLKGQVVYYSGPTPPRSGMTVGSAGPTTSSRMDVYATTLMEKTGLKGMIGKGNRGDAVVDVMKKHGCVYFAATGGAGVLIAKCIKTAEVVCYQDLGPEAIFRFQVVNMPLIVAIDMTGNNVYMTGPLKFRKAFK
jgi:fumarate hydratase subunit beta